MNTLHCKGTFGLFAFKIEAFLIVSNIMAIKLK